MASSHDNKVDLERLGKYAAMGLSVREISLLFNIPHTIFRRIMDDRPEVQQTIDRGKAQAVYSVAAVLYQKAIKNHDLKACELFLRMHGDNWKNSGPQIEINNTLNVDNSVFDRETKLRIAKTYVKLNGAEEQSEQ